MIIENIHLWEHYVNAGHIMTMVMCLTITVISANLYVNLKDVPDKSARLFALSIMIVFAGIFLQSLGLFSIFMLDTDYYHTFDSILLVVPLLKNVLMLAGVCMMACVMRKMFYGTYKIKLIALIAVFSLILEILVHVIKG